MAWKPKPYRYRPVSKIVSQQNRNEALNEVVANLLEDMGIEKKRIDGWHLSIKFTEDNPEYLAYMDEQEIYKAKAKLEVTK